MKALMRLAGTLLPLPVWALAVVLAAGVSESRADLRPDGPEPGVSTFADRAHAKVTNPAPSEDRCTAICPSDGFRCIRDCGHFSYHICESCCIWY
jgi:hypothetical protein